MAFVAFKYGVESALCIISVFGKGNCVYHVPGILTERCVAYFEFE